MQVLDHGYVELIETWGSDERIIEAARMSTAKGFQGWGPNYHKPPCRTDVPLYPSEAGPCSVCGVKHGDEKLLKYLWEHKHHTPFEMAGMTIEVQAPIFVFREWHRHRTQSYSELSGRYTPIPDLHYIPSGERIVQGVASTNKQAQGVVLADPVKVDEWVQILREVTALSQRAYELGLAAGVPKELARLSVQVNRYSRMRASANLRNWLAFLTLRLAPNAQWEIQQYAGAVGHFVAKTFPRTYLLWSQPS